MRAAERDVGVKPENSGHYGSGQTWTLPDACNITLDADRAVEEDVDGGEQYA